jgi:hypothetical protein
MDILKIIAGSKEFTNLVMEGVESILILNQIDNNSIYSDDISYLSVLLLKVAKITRLYQSNFSK